jgi:Fic family protein
MTTDIHVLPDWPTFRWDMGRLASPVAAAKHAHPLDDGNGRIARAIADMSLARPEKSPQWFCSMSAQIREERSDYCGIPERTQTGTLDVTAWMEWFPGCLTRAIEGAQMALSGVIDKAR